MFKILHQMKIKSNLKGCFLVILFVLPIPLTAQFHSQTFIGDQIIEDILQTSDSTILCFSRASDTILFPEIGESARFSAFNFNKNTNTFNIIEHSLPDSLYRLNHPYFVNDTLFLFGVYHSKEKGVNLPCIVKTSPDFSFHSIIPIELPYRFGDTHLTSVFKFDSHFYVAIRDFAAGSLKTNHFIKLDYSGKQLSHLYHYPSRGSTEQFIRPIFQIDSIISYTIAEENSIALYHIESGFTSHKDTILPYKNKANQQSGNGYIFDQAGFTKLIDDTIVIGCRHNALSINPPFSDRTMSFYLLGKNFDSLGVVNISEPMGERHYFTDADYSESLGIVSTGMSDYPGTWYPPEEYNNVILVSRNQSPTKSTWKIRFSEPGVYYPTKIKILSNNQIAVAGFYYNENQTDLGDPFMLILSEQGEVLSISDHQKGAELLLNVYPNPATETTKIEWGLGNAPQSIAIYNLHGQLLQKQTIQTKASLTLNVSNLQPGTYVLSATFQDGRTSNKRLLIRSY